MGQFFQATMSLSPGTRLGGTTTDTQPGHQVALKTLPDAFAADLDRLARFNGIRALVLEPVKGPTLVGRRG